MKVELGDIVESELGRGEVVSITREWIIHEISKPGNSLEKEEVALPISEVWLPITEAEISRTHFVELDLDSKIKGVVFSFFIWLEFEDIRLYSSKVD